MSIQDIIAGAACRIIINGEIVGFATSINISRDQGIRPIFGVDSPLAQELLIGGPIAISGTIQGFRVRTSKGFEGANIINSTTLSQYFNQKYSVIEIIDKLTGATLAKIEKAIFYFDNIAISNKSLVVAEAKFMGIWMTPEITKG